MFVLSGAFLILDKTTSPCYNVMGSGKPSLFIGINTDEQLFRRNATDSHL